MRLFEHISIEFEPKYMPFYTQWIEIRPKMAESANSCEKLVNIPF